MRIFKSHSLLSLVNGYLVDSPQPSNISYLWNFGSLLGFCLIIQIITGVTLAMHYNPSVLEAFNSVEHIMRDVNNGWLIRYLHSNTASAFFFLVYLHIGRGLYYGSYRAPRTLVWTIGTVIFILMMATAFLGYEHSPKWINNLYIYTFNNESSYVQNILYLAYSKSYSTSSNGRQTLEVKTYLSNKGLKPVYIYNNLQLQETKNNIKLDLTNLSGIYMIFNNITKDYYIGSASTNKFFLRLSSHMYNLTGSKVVKLAIRKYGLVNFSFIVLELFPEVVNKDNNKRLLDLEDFYLKSLLPNYNILTEAGNSFGYKHTELHRIKMKCNYSQARRDRIGNLNAGKSLTLSTKEKIREKALLREPRVFSEQSLLNMKNKSKGIILYNIENMTVFGEYNSIKDASLSVGCCIKSITRALSTPKKILKRRFLVKLK